MSRFKLHKKSDTNKRMSHTFQVNLLRVEINNHKRKIKNLEARKEELEKSVFSDFVFTYLTSIKVRAFIKRSLDNYVYSICLIHFRKLENLGLIISDSHNSKAIYNDTNVIFTEDELSLLAKGLRYSFFPNSIDFKKVQMEFESLFSQIAPSVDTNNNLLRLKSCLVKCYDTYISSFIFSKKSDRYFSADIHNTIKSIKEKVERCGLIIVKADKGNTVVIFYKKSYDEKMLTILNDRSKFESVSEENTLDRLKKFQSFLRYHYKRGVFTDSEYSELFPTRTSIPTMYGLPKTHKPGIPLRPILSMVGTFNHSLAKWMGRKLESMRTARSIAKDSFSLHCLKDSNLGAQYFVSYDIVSLFTNILLDETINHIIDTLYPKTPGVSQKDQRFEGMTRTVFRRALDWCVRNNVFIFSGKCYQQIDGCAMGSPLAPILADIFMNKLLESNIQRNGHDQMDVTFKQTEMYPQFILKLFVRYVDDTLAVFDTRANALLFLKYLNSLHPNI